MEKGSKTHPGRSSVRSLLDSFSLQGPQGQEHHCLVHTPLWESVLTFLRRNPVERLPVPVVAFVLKRLFLALEFLHTECQIVHTGVFPLCIARKILLPFAYRLDIKADNIMLGIDEDAVFYEFEQDELDNPCARKEAEDGRIIYESGQLRMPKRKNVPVLCDFGSAVPGDRGQSRALIQPDVYRAPEVILEAPWTYSVDIWNAGCMVRLTVSWNMYVTYTHNSSRTTGLGHFRRRPFVYGP